jgi:hypothetical protein
MKNPDRLPNGPGLQTRGGGVIASKQLYAVHRHMTCYFHISGRMPGKQTAALPKSLKINAAVRDGLAVCLPARSPIAQLATYIGRLRSSGEWSIAEISEIDHRIRRMLAEIADPTENTDGSV